MTTVRRGMILDLDLDPVVGSETGKVRPCIVVTNERYNARVPVIQVTPITAWSDKKARIKTNVVLEPSEENGLTKKSIADCLQTRPVDFKKRLVSIRGQLSEDDLEKVDEAIRAVFGF